MVLAVDIGNTNIVVGGFEGDKILFRERVSTNPLSTDLEYATAFRMALHMHDYNSSQLTGAIISSVVPSVTNTVKRAIEKYAGVKELSRRDDYDGNGGFNGCADLKNFTAS